MCSDYMRKTKNIYLSSFKGINKNVANEIKKFSGPYVYLDGIILEHKATREKAGIFDVSHGCNHATPNEIGTRPRVSSILCYYSGKCSY